MAILFIRPFFVFFFIFLSEIVKSCQNVVMKDLPCHNCINTAKIVKMLEMDKHVEKCQKRIPSAYKIPKYFFYSKIFVKMFLMLQEVLPDLPVKGKFFGKHFYHLILAMRGYH